MKIVFIFFLFLIKPVFASSFDKVYDEFLRTSNLNLCYESAAKYYNIPEVMLRVISNIESRGDIYALNIKGKGYHDLTKAEALELLEKNKNKSLDIGLMQINSSWFKKNKYPLEFGLNPCWNVYMGAYILGYEYRRHNKDIWQAVAHYHSPTKKYQQRYVKKIYAEVVKWQGRD